MTLQESGEMYIETIHVLSQQLPSVRSIDVSEHMGFSKPSVSRAIGILKKEGYVNMDAHGLLTLTDLGKAVAEKIYERHLILTKCLTMLGVSDDVAAEDACRMEHIISDETFSAIKKHVNSLSK